MRPNEKITCPFCKESSMAKVKNVLDGFTKVGEVLVCMLCDSELGTVESLAESNDVQSNQKIRDLGVLLGAAPAARARLAAADDEKRFCKDCKHFLKHPFEDRCDLDNHPVDPMDDCENFQKR